MKPERLEEITKRHAETAVITQKAHWSQAFLRDHLCVTYRQEQELLDHIKDQEDQINGMDDSWAEDRRDNAERIEELEAALEKADQVISGLVPSVEPNAEDIQWAKNVVKDKDNQTEE